VIVGLAGLVACSSDGTSSSSSGGSSSSSGSGGSDAGAGDSGSDGGGGVVVNGCKTFVDESAPTAARKIVWDFAVSTAANRCMIVKKGQQVAFEGDFTVHPLGPLGGNGPNPFSSVPDTGKVTFPNTGTFGFACKVHPAMLGAIQVIE